MGCPRKMFTPRLQNVNVLKPFGKTKKNLEMTGAPWVAQRYERRQK